MQLSSMDIRALMQDPSAHVRGDIGAKIAEALKTPTLSKKEKDIAADILRLLVRDIEVTVRQAIALSLADAGEAPRDVVLKLAHDVTDVALPLLEYSTVLSEDDLIEIAQSTEEALKLLAITRRETISAPLSDALLQSGLPQVMHSLIVNRGAVIEEHSLTQLWDSITEHDSLLEALVHRGGLSVGLAEKLFATVSDELKMHLASAYRLPYAMVSDKIDQAREWSTLQVMLPEEQGGRPLSEYEVETMVHQLYTSGRLTYSLIIRALCLGDLNFFEAALARLASVSRSNARILLFEGGQRGFEALYYKARLPENFMDAIGRILHISLEETSYGRMRRDDFRKRVIERIKTEGWDQTVEHMAYLLAIISSGLPLARGLH